MTILEGTAGEVGKTARSLFEVMRESPVTLSLVLFNILFLGMFYLSQSEERDFRTKLVDYMAESDTRSMDMIYNCALGEKKLPLPPPAPPPPETPAKRGPR